MSPWLIQLFKGVLDWFINRGAEKKHFEMSYRSVDRNMCFIY